MQNFGNHMETGTFHGLETEQRTKKIRKNGTKLQIHDMKRHKQLRGSHNLLTIFLQFCM